jgi:hypothetical protein
MGLWPATRLILGYPSNSCPDIDPGPRQETPGVRYPQRSQGCFRFRSTVPSGLVFRAAKRTGEWGTGPKRPQCPGSTRSPIPFGPRCNNLVLGGVDATSTANVTTPGRRDREVVKLRSPGPTSSTLERLSPQCRANGLTHPIQL